MSTQTDTIERRQLDELARRVAENKRIARQAVQNWQTVRAAEQGNAPAGTVSAQDDAEVKG